MIEELEKQFAWQNINTSEEKNKILSGRAIAIENEKVKLTHKDGKIYEDNINCVIVNFKNIKVLIPGKELGLEKDDKKTIRNLIGSEIKFIILESDKLTNTAVGSRKKAMERMEMLEDGKVTFTYITNQDEIDVNAEPGDHEGLVEIGRNIEGVEVSVFIRQKDDTNSYKVSMRSKSYVNVSDVCLMFGGGGHPRAAGCLIQGDIEQVKQKIMAEIRKVL